MHLLTMESNGPAAPENIHGESVKPSGQITENSSSLPFGQSISLASINGPTYLTAQLLVQQVAYTLCDRIWVYSPESYELDVAMKSWIAESTRNAYGYATKVEQMQIRKGAASIALGYMFSKDFDLKKRYIPQSIISPASVLNYLRDALDQLSLLYAVASPFVAHIAAIDYAVGSSATLVTDYVSSMVLAEDLGFGLLLSFSAYEIQHMSLFATLLADYVPIIHTFDGVNAGRETIRIVDALDQGGLYNTYKAVQRDLSTSEKRKFDIDIKVAQVLEALNSELGTTYKLFEYQGHSAPISVLVVFGTVESSLASQVALSLEKNGSQIGVINVRVYRPFVEEEFLRILPKSVQTLGVLGQVHDHSAVSDIGIHSRLYEDILAAVTFSQNLSHHPTVVDVKYSREQVWSPVSIAAAFQFLVQKPILQSHRESTDSYNLQPLQLVDPLSVQQYIFWTFDKSSIADVPMILGQALSKDSASNVTVRTDHDNLLQGGITRTDIRKSRKSIEASFSIVEADFVFVGAQTLLKTIDVLSSLKFGGTIIVNLPRVQDSDLENQLPAAFRKALITKNIDFYVLDPTSIESVANDIKLEKYLVEIAFLHVGVPALKSHGIQKLASINGNLDILEDLAGRLESALRKVEIPQTWATEDVEKTVSVLPHDITTNSFTYFKQAEAELASSCKDWKTVAKALAFQEAYGSMLALRPDVAVKTYTVTVKENRRLTPLTYDRNIFHIEFDLGDSGLSYEIGESLGIHAENNGDEVLEFIKFYGLNPEDVAEVSSREDLGVVENRTVYQILMQNLDLFGRPPKRFYEALAEFAKDPKEKKELLTLGGPEGATEFKRRAEVDTITYADILLEFSSARPSFHDIIRIVSPMKRREYSIASCQNVTPTSVALMIVVVGWVDPKGRDRFGQATRFLNKLGIGAAVTVSVKPSVMKLPPSSTQPLIMAGLGTGLAPFRAFVQHRAWEKGQGTKIGAVLLYMGSRHQREEYCYGEEWEAYQDAGVITLLGRAFSRDQPQKIYIQDRMRETMKDITQAYLKEDGAFYLCGPTWPVPDVTNVLEDAIALDARTLEKRVDPKREIERLKDQGRYVLEVY